MSEVGNGFDESAERVRTAGTLCYLRRVLPPASDTGGDNHSAMPEDTDGDLSLVAYGMSAKGVKDNSGDLSLVADAKLDARNGCIGNWTGDVTVVPQVPPSADLGGGSQEPGKGYESIHLDCTGRDGQAVYEDACELAEQLIDGLTG